MDKTGRNGIRVGDILLPDFRERYNFLKNKHKEILKQYNYNSKSSSMRMHGLREWLFLASTILLIQSTS
jgi:adenylosuccinate synthase